MKCVSILTNEKYYDFSLTFYLLFLIITFKNIIISLKNQTTAATIGTFVKYTINKADDRVSNAVA